MTASLLYKKRGIYSILFSITFFVSVGYLLSFTQAFGISPDYEEYESFFRLVRFDKLKMLDLSRFEKGFTVTAVILTIFIESNLIVYSVIVSGAMLLKGITLSLISSSQTIFFTVALFYFARYFALHELTQLRAACGIAFLLIASILIWSGKWHYGLLACGCALLYHTSSAAIIPILFFQATKRLSIIAVGFSTFICIFLSAHFLINYLESSIPSITMYQSQGFGRLEPNPLSVALLLDWIMIIATLSIWWNKSSPLMKRIIFMEVIGMALFYGLIKYPVVAHRLRDIYSVFWIFFVADGLRNKSTGIPVIVFVVTSIGWYSYMTFGREFFQ